jgi:hypothetical protein
MNRILTADVILTLTHEQFADIASALGLCAFDATLAAADRADFDLVLDVVNQQAARQGVAV